MFCCCYISLALFRIIKIRDDEDLIGHLVHFRAAAGVFLSVHSIVFCLLLL